MPEETQQAYHKMVKMVAQYTDQTVLQLNEKALELFNAWAAEIETMLRDGGDLENMRDWGGKLAGETIRLAAVIHGFTRGHGESVDADAIASAITIARYLIPHAEAVLNMMQVNECHADGDARYILAWIERHQLKRFTKSEAQHHGKRRFPKAQDIDSALQTLIGRGYIRVQPSPQIGPGRPSSPAFEVNPVVFEDDRPTIPSQATNDKARILENQSL